MTVAKERWQVLLAEAEHPDLLYPLVQVLGVRRYRPDLRPLDQEALGWNRPCQSSFALADKIGLVGVWLYPAEKSFWSLRGFTRLAQVEAAGWNVAAATGESSSGKLVLDVTVRAPA